MFQVCIVAYYCINILLALVRAVMGWNPKKGAPAPRPGLSGVGPFLTCDHSACCLRLQVPRACGFSLKNGKLCQMMTSMTMMITKKRVTRSQLLCRRT